MSDSDRAATADGYAPVLELLGAVDPRQSKVVLDVSPSAASREEAIATLGWTPVALDPRAAKKEPTRGVATGTTHDVREYLSAEHLMRKAHELLEGRTIAAVLLIDVLERVADPRDLIQELRGLALRHPEMRLIVQVPNVSTMDRAVALLFGEWRPLRASGPTSFCQLYTARQLQEMMTSAGWQECGCRDVSREREDTDQVVAALASTTPLYELLGAVREQAGLGAGITELVRAYAPESNVVTGLTPGLPAPERTADEDRAPFLSVLLRTQGRRPQTLQETLLSLFAQTSQNFEIVLACHRVTPESLGAIQRLVASYPEEFRGRIRMLEVHEGGRSRPLNAAVAHARGTYVAILDDDDLAFGNWVESFEDARATNGHVLRAVVAEQVVAPVDWDGEEGYEPRGKPRLAWPAAFDLMDHLVENQTPPSGYAFPRTAFYRLGLAFDEDLPVLEDWDLAMQAALLCGVTSISSVTSLYRAWQGAENSLSLHSEREWRAARAAIHARLDARPWPLPVGSISELVEMRQKTGPRFVAASVSAAGGDVPVLRHALALREQELLALRTSTSWRLTGPLRLASRIARHLLAAQAKRHERLARKQT